jgi:uncharacterized protein (DUF1697 family)
MISYVAFVRGILPTNPNMRNDKLRGAFEAAGLANVRTVISSGNVLFDSPSADTAALESQIEHALESQLGFANAVFVRNRSEIQALVDHDPFRGAEHSHKTNLTVTFLKTQPTLMRRLPFTSENRDYTIVGAVGREICSVIDLTGTTTPKLMSWLEKEFGKDITTRTYKTVGRILITMHENTSSDS